MTTKAKPYFLTREGLERLTEELNKLKTDGREKLAERLRLAFQDGQDDDFVDNAELEAARNEQSFVEGRIQDLEQILSNYQIIDEMDVPHDQVHIGARVTVVEDGFEDEEEYLLVGQAEADVINGRISDESPLGVALLGSKIGDRVMVKAPRGETIFRVKEISY